jgi:transcription initiation factor TFIIIB Brf1 subunit/transcription initiation factor TFIIB
VNFVEASERLKRAVTDDEIAEATGVSTNTIRRTRADPTTRNYRPPPTGWQAIFSRLARERARDLDALASELDATAEERKS